MRPFRFSFARSSSPSGGRRPRCRPSRGDDLEAIPQVLGASPDVDADLARCPCTATRSCRRSRPGPRFSRISWKSREDAEPPRMLSSSEAANRRRSEREMPGRARGRRGTARCPCAGSGCPARGARTSGARTRGVPGRGSAASARRARAARGDGCGRGSPRRRRRRFRARTWRGGRRRLDRRVIDEITSAVPTTGRPSGRLPNTAAAIRSWT